MSIYGAREVCSFRGVSFGEHFMYQRVTHVLPDRALCWLHRPYDPRQQPPRFQVGGDALRHELGLLHWREVRRGLAEGDDARRGAWEVAREEVPVEGGPRPADDDRRELRRLTHR